MPDPMPIPRADLRAALIDSAQSGRPTEGLARLAMRIARGHLARDEFSGYSHSEKDDILGMWTLRFMRGWSRIDPSKNPHAYISRSVKLTAMDYSRSNFRTVRREAAKAKDETAREMDRISRFSVERNAVSTFAVLAKFTPVRVSRRKLS
jgi:hypothetical protein